MHPLSGLRGNSFIINHENRHHMVLSNCPLLPYNYTCTLFNAQVKDD